MDPTTIKHPAQAFKFRISNSLVLGLVVLILMIITTSFSIIWYEGRPKLLSMNVDAQTKLGQNISLALERELREVRGIARGMAASALALPDEDKEQNLRRIVPAMLQASAQGKMIAGGGIWPEPYTLDPRRARSSLFWGKDATGAPVFVDGYNAPHSAGYHNEEWYVPAQFFDQHDVYWSRSYTDPYTLRDMVTCAIPMISRDGLADDAPAEEGAFIGVATVDLALESLARELNQLMTGFDAYAFIVDRNNRFIVFPTLGFDVSRTQVYSSDNGFEYLADLARVYPAFDVIAQRLAALDETLFTELKNSKPEYLRLISSLSEKSYQISPAEAERIIAHLWLKEKAISQYPRPLARFELQEDLLLRGKSTGFIYQMPSTGWRIVTVFEYRAYGAISELVSQTLFGAILMSSIAFGVLAFFLMKIFVLDRIRKMVHLLSTAVDQKGSSSLKLDYGINDELGMLGYWFNRRSEQLESAINTAQKANRAKSDFLAGMSQELKTPLNSIIGFNRRLIIKLGSDLDEQNYKTLVAIQRSSNYLLSLIDDILEVSELESGTVRLKYAWESVNLMIDDAASQMSGQIADAGIAFHTEPLVEDLRMFVDRQKVIQVLMHLLANAVQTEGSGSINLKVEKTRLAEHEAIAFSVSDSGIGISHEEKLRIYKQFSQVEEASTLEKGMGLGLYVIREITALHGGAVYFESTLNVGSTFKVVLPVRANLEHESDF